MKDQVTHGLKPDSCGHWAPVLETPVLATVGAWRPGLSLATRPASVSVIRDGVLPLGKGEFADGFKPDDCQCGDTETERELLSQAVPLHRLKQHGKRYLTRVFKIRGCTVYLGAISYPLTYRNITRPYAGPQWGDWAPWSACSVTCHQGWRMRTRHCEDSTKGLTLSSGQCYGASQEYGACELQQCPHAGPQWGDWAPWSACSVTCHQGWRMRTRHCEDSTKGLTLSSGQCYGASQEYGACELQQCPRWESWSAWGECSTQTTCGPGVKVRQRVCSNGGTVGVDRYCLGLANQSTPCSGVPCNGPMRLAGGSVPGEGRLEIYDDQHQQWTLVCADQMTTAMASLACRQLGWPGGHAAVTDGRFGSGSGQFGLTSVTCKGSDLTVAACEHNQWTASGVCAGGATLAAGVQCDVNGVWSLWSSWSQCSVTCEGGTQTRTRQCDHPPRLHGGRDCEGESIQTKSCTLEMCPVDGVWQVWGPWDACSVSCGNGTQTRHRDCYGPFYDGDQCEGDANQTRDCMDRHCPVDGVWAAWSSWGECSQTCASGTRTRDRNCTGPFYEGRPCDGAFQEEESCNTHDCPVDGEWLQWQAWADCSVSCGGGARQRTRTCKQPLNGGLVCNGNATEAEDCNQHFCPIDGVWSPWAQWSECTVTCSNGTQWRNRTCNGPHHLGKDCEGDENETRVCMPRICPVDGQWMDWTPWSSCSVSCGGGSRERSRDCYLGQHGGANCTGSDKETMSCNQIDCPGRQIFVEELTACGWPGPSGATAPRRAARAASSGSASVTAVPRGQQLHGPGLQERDCNTHYCPVNGVWNMWSDWSICTVTCGGGNQSRQRDCQGPFHGGDPCEGLTEETQDCNIQNCPVNGYFTLWSAWDACDVPCGGGVQGRNRSCVGPFHGGDDCEGLRLENRTCNMHHCPIDGVFSNWTTWSDCSVSCGGGVANRSRDCDGPFYGGKNCEGPWEEQKVCNDQPCPEDGEWLPWSAWGGCSETCGGGEQSRERACAGVLHGGDYCRGEGNQTRACNTHHCPVDGVFRSWTEWTECTLTCGGGSTFRSRECYGPFYGGADCSGQWDEAKACNTAECPVDGSWKPWAAWGPCSVTCGGGFKSRARECDLALHGGENCTGPSEQNNTCNMHHCPVNGVWNMWSDWSICTVTCGGGNQSRQRDCQGPFHGGDPCEGLTEETQDCNIQNCPVNGYFTLWSAWGACDVPCGGGVQGRNRSCVGPFHGGDDCEGLRLENRTCNMHHCPIDGVFSNWTTWSDCSVSCGGGVANRSRDCDGPFYGGKNCEGPLEEQKVCNDQPCPEDGEWLPWSAWGGCSETCGGGEQSRERACAGVLHGGDYCQGEGNETRACNTHHCPVDGVWEAWSDWGQCSASCGGGLQARNRSCDGPHHLGQDCLGPAEENQTCNTQPCPIDGYYGDWSSWGKCSVSCGGGTQSRDRPCIPPQHGGTDCQGPSNETQACSTQPCPVDGVYLDWSPWSDCSVSCGGGHQWRNRTCQPPEHGGQDCAGPDNVTQDCNTQPCPIDGVWLAWSDWSVCTTTCGGGLSERTRQCQTAQHGGEPCHGAAKENKSCAENPCPIPGDWYPWTEWTRCTATCGGGTKYRERECDTQSYGNLTAPCEGPANETVPCHTFDCLPLARTCSELGVRGLSESTMADIDVDGPGITTLEPVLVYCDMEAEDGAGVTIVGHDQERRQQVDGWEGAREYEVRLNYNISFEHVEVLVDQSGDCQQYISWECFAALIHNPNDNFRVSTGWLNRTGQIADYFGGAAPGSHSCACGMNSTCVEEDLKCNCDANDEVWRQDDGYLTYKDDLPVYAFVAGDTGGVQEDGYHIVGSLSCHGQETRDLKKPWLR
ncbi:hypothetical protein EGW08_004409 [Elysia chlorotica]|uniref:SRCR domain-containing protein n=1 Tax=Elysia chlorotica TaxID=188477 RepID=A0A3S0ZWL5_ELYCH|nr:hypothetical protein EGW08_004409 [Elysia chlorotica]